MGPCGGQAIRRLTVLSAEVIGGIGELQGPTVTRFERFGRKEGGRKEAAAKRTVSRARRTSSGSTDLDDARLRKAGRMTPTAGSRYSFRPAPDIRMTLCPRVRLLVLRVAVGRRKL